MREIIAFCGGDDGAGCTMAAQSAAEVLAEKEPGKVLLVSASGKYGDDYILNRENRSMDDIRANLMSGSLQPSELYPCLVREKNIRVLPALSDVLSASYYPETCMQTLLQGAEGFRYIVIDCGSRFDYGMYISGAKAAGRRYYVVTQQEKCLRRFQYAVREVLQPLQLSGELILNKYQLSAALLSCGEIEALTGMKAAVRIPYVSYGWQAELEKETLMCCSKYSRAMRRLVRQIRDEEGKKSWKKSLTLRST